MSEVSDVGQGKNGRVNDAEPPGEKTECRRECRTGHSGEPAAGMGSVVPIDDDESDGHGDAWEPPPVNNRKDELFAPSDYPTPYDCGQ